VLKRIYRELPDVVAITIHDSIMTGVMTNNVEAVKTILIEEMTNFVGFRPNVTLEGIIEKEGENRRERERIEGESIVIR
jgi:predicted HAD superfamily phosphohydrolase YqeG